jgi:GTP-binding protein Era
MTEPFKSGYVVLAGCPNVGKSSLLNQILSEKVSIVSKVPQTTRSRIVGIRHLPGAQLVFLDTPGLHRPYRRLNQRMVKQAKTALFDADVVLFVVDVTRPPGEGDESILELLSSVPPAERRPVFLLLNKIDLINKSRLLPLIEFHRQRYPFQLFLPVSAETGDGVESLLEAIVSVLPQGAPHYPSGQSSDQALWFRIAEIIREKVLHHTRQEVPHSVAVLIEEFSEPEGDEANGLVRIRAHVVVERDSQKGILIGRGGQMLKTVGSEARQEIEQLLGKQLFLSLWVTVKEEWREDERFLDEVGY